MTEIIAAIAIGGFVLCIGIALVIGVAKKDPFADDNRFVSPPTTRWEWTTTTTDHEEWEKPRRASTEEEDK